MKKNLLYLITVILLAACWMLLKHLEVQQQKDLFARRSEKVFPGLKKDDASQIELEMPGERFLLEKKEFGWVFEKNDFPANQVYVEILLDEFTKLTFGDLITDRVENHPDYKLDAKSKLIILRDGKGEELARVYVGKPGENYRTAFFRLKDDPRVFHTVTDLFPAVTRSCWYERGIWQIPESALPLIKITLDNRKAALSQTNTGWENQDHQAIDTEKVRSILNLVARHAADQRQEFANMSPCGSIQIETGPVVMTLQLFRTDSGYAAVRPSLAGLVYFFPENFLSFCFN